MKFIVTIGLFLLLLLAGRTTLMAQTVVLSVSGGNTGTWTAPSTGGPFYLRITARGGDGGAGINPNDGSLYAGGGGATMSGTFEVAAGQTIRVISGAKGANGDIYSLDELMAVAAVPER